MPTTGKKTGNFVGKKIHGVESQGKIREFYKNMSEKYQGIFNLFHNIKKNYRNDVWKYIQKLSTLLYLSNFEIF